MSRPEQMIGRDERTEVGERDGAPRIGRRRKQRLVDVDAQTNCDAWIARDDMPLTPDDVSGEESRHTTTETSAEALAEALLRTLMRLKLSEQRMWREDGATREAANTLQGLSVSRARLLKALVEAGAGRMRMSDLSHALGVTARNVTTIVDGLERAGFLARRPDPTDRRAIMLELTAFGRDHIERVLAMKHATSERVFAPLDSEERGQLMRLLRKLAEGADVSSERASPLSHPHDPLPADVAE